MRERWLDLFCRGWDGRGGVGEEGRWRWGRFCGREVAKGGGMGMVGVLVADGWFDGLD